MKTKEKIYSKKSVSITREKLMYLILNNPLLVNGDLDEDNENYILRISSDGYLNFEDIKNEPKADAFRLLINCAQLHTLCSEFSFSLNPENIAFDINLNPKIIDRDLPDENNDFVSEYKALIGCVLYPKYTFDDYYNGGKDLYKKKKLLKKLKEIDNTEAIKEELMQEYSKIIKDVKDNKILVSKKSRTAFKIAIPIMATLTVAIGVLGSYLFFVHTPYQKKLTFAANAYIAENYISVQNELSEIKLDRIPAEQKYILARSFVITEALTNEQKENILDSITLKTDERVLSYWIELGRLNFDEAIDYAKQLGDDQLLLFSLIKKNAAVKSDTQISGQEKATMISDLETQIKNLTEKIQQNAEFAEQAEGTN